jgi:hypothetical protein
MVCMHARTHDSTYSLQLRMSRQVAHAQRCAHMTASATCCTWQATAVQAPASVAVPSNKQSSTAEKDKARAVMSYCRTQRWFKPASTSNQIKERTLQLKLLQACGARKLLVEPKRVRVYTQYRLQHAPGIKTGRVTTHSKTRQSPSRQGAPTVWCHAGNKTITHRRPMRQLHGIPPISSQATRRKQEVQVISQVKVSQPTARPRIAYTSSS